MCSTCKFISCARHSVSLPSHGYRPEHVESRQSRGDHHAGHLRVPVDLLDLRLALVQEEQLWRQVLDALHPGADVARLHRQVPLADHVVGPRRGEHARVHGAPLHGGDGGAVLLEVGHRSAALWFRQRGLWCENVVYLERKEQWTKSHEPSLFCVCLNESVTNVCNGNFFDWLRLQGQFPFFKEKKLALYFAGHSSIQQFQ